MSFNPQQGLNFSEIEQQALREYFDKTAVKSNTEQEDEDETSETD